MGKRIFVRPSRLFGCYIGTNANLSSHSLYNYECSLIPSLKKPFPTKARINHCVNSKIQFLWLTLQRNILAHLLIKHIFEIFLDMIWYSNLHMLWANVYGILITSPMPFWLPAVCKWCWLQSVLNWSHALAISGALKCANPFSLCHIHRNWAPECFQLHWEPTGAETWKDNWGCE